MMMNKKVLSEKIKMIKDNELLKEIFKIVLDEKIYYTINKNGVHFNINLLSDVSIDRIIEIVCRYKEEIIIHDLIKPNEEDIKKKIYKKYLR